jgi:tetratricopeptide (TPR) repeat protein
MPPTEPLERFLRALGTDAEHIPVSVDEQAALFRSLSAGRRLIVMLDNAATAAQVRPLLPGAGSSLVVVTTRRRLSGLAVNGARYFDLHPLNESGAMELLDRLVGSDRVEAEPQETRSLITLCGRLPLAVCASGARLATHRRWSIGRAVQELADETNRLSTLRMEDDVSVRAAFDLSYRALAADAARLYRLLGLHPGPDFDAAAAAALAGLDRDTAADLLDVLAGANLLQEETGERYRFHDLLRLHARETMTEIESDTDREVAFARLAEWYLETAVAADVALLSRRWHIGRYYSHYESQPHAVFENRSAGLAWLETELSTLIAVTEQAQSQGLHETVWQICEALATFFSRRKHYRNWIKTFQIGLAAAQACEDRIAQARMLEALGLAYLNLRDFSTANRCHHQALDLERAAGHRIGETSALEGLGIAELATGDPDRAIGYFTRARDILQELGRPRGVALMGRRLGEAAKAAGRLTEAIELLNSASRFFGQADEPYHESRTLNELADAYLHSGRLDAAERALQKALATTERIGARHETASVLVTLARLAALREDAADERNHLRQALAIFTELGAPQAEDITRRLGDMPPESGGAEPGSAQ